MHNLIFRVLSLFILPLAVIGLTSTPLPAASIESQIAALLPQFETTMRRLEAIQSQLEVSGRNNRDYDEQKNLWISTVLAVDTISAICEYENDLLSLFLDLKPHRRPYYYDVRIQSIETSAQQMGIMQRQVQINISLLKLSLNEQRIFDEIQAETTATIELLAKCRALIKQLAAQP